ncbi:MAG TPA: hypothetical protein VGG56_14025 [Terracidiphilus sp.]|jgi:hypothetical protein
MWDGERSGVQIEFQEMSLPTAQEETSLIRAVHDRYRCPEGFLDFRLSEGLSPDSGYFQFGSDTICYGRTSKGAHQAQLGSHLCDTLPDVLFDGMQLVLPFDPNEVIDNLRLERYAGNQLGNFEKALKNIYYRLRPLTNRPLRRGIQRLRAVNWQNRRFPNWPVDTTVENICEKLLLLSSRSNDVDCVPFIWFWPNGARGCVSMTHDVEAIAGYNFCKQLLDIDDSFGIKASYQIVPEGRYLVTPEFLNRLRNRGCEVCVQDLNHDGRLFDEREEFRRRAALINRYGREYGAKGFRSAVLYRNPEWLEDLDFSFDMSAPNVANLDPQRGGCCTVMPYFIGDVLELPLTTIQDYSLFHVLNEHSIDLWRTQLEMILAKNGLASFIVHPDYIIEAETQAVYKDLLAMLSELRGREEVWFALPGEIDSWWRARSRMSIVKDGGSWRVVGDGAERAVVAFAKVVDGQLICEPADTQKSELLLCEAK